jgi:hypothetical protein
MLVEDLHDPSRVSHVGWGPNRAGEAMLVPEQRRELDQTPFSLVDENERVDAQLGQLRAERPAEGSACARDENARPREVVRELVGRDVDYSSAEQRLGRDVRALLSIRLI